MNKFYKSIEEEETALKRLYELSPKNFSENFIEENEIIKRENNKVKIKVFPWIFKGVSCNLNITEDGIYLPTLILNKYLKKCGYTLQLYYDVLHNISSISERPVCSVCGEKKYFRRFTEGYLCKNGKRCSSTIRKRNIESRTKYVKDNEESQFLNFVNKNPNKGKRYKKEEYYDSSSKSYILFGWIIGKTYDIKIGKSSINETLLKLGYNFQIYYDVIILGLESINDRPKCIICGNPCMFFSKGHTYKYLRVCSEECRDRANFNSSKYLSGVYKSEILGITLGYDSSWELKFIKYGEVLYKKGLIKSFDRCLDKIKYYNDIDNKHHNYHPDFTIILNDGKKVVIELKPANLLKNSREVYLKKMAALKYYMKSKTDYIILTENELFKNIKGSFNVFDYIV